MKFIVSHEHGLGYFVVPKVACTSIKAALLPLFGLPEAGYWYTNRRGERVLRVHKMFDESDHQLRRRDVAELWESTLRGYFTFTFVRNPWDRLHSCWVSKVAHRKRDNLGVNQPKHSSVRFRPRMGFAEFVETVAEIPDGDSDIHLISQYVQVSAPWDPTVTLPSFIGRFERLAEDFAHVSEALGLDEPLELPHLNRAVRRSGVPYREHYDARLRDLVAQRYAEDIERFGYDF